MRKLLIAFLILIIIPIIAYSCIWFYVSNNIKTEITKTLATQSNVLKTTYTDIKTTGFPLQYNVEIINPKITLNTGKIIKDHYSRTKKQITLPKESWEHTYYVDGKIIIHTDAMINYFTTTTQGNVKIDSQFGKTTNTYTFTQAQDNTNKLTFHKPMLYPTIQNLQLTPTEILNSIKTLETNIKQIKLQNQKTQQTLMQQELGSLKIDNNLANNTLNLRMQLKDNEHTTAFDEHLINTPYLQAIFAYEDFHIEDELPSILGKKNILLELELPTDTFQESTDPNNIKTKFTLKHFDYSDALVSYKSNALLDLETKNNKPVNLAIKFNTTFTQTEQAYNINKKRFNRYLHNNSNESMQLLMFAPPSTSNKVEALFHIEDKADVLLPKWHELGDIKINLDMLYRANAKGIPQSINVNKLEYITKPYSIKANTQLKFPYGPMMPQGQAQLHLTSYKTLIDTIADYSHNILDLINATTYPDGEPTLPKELITATKTFLKEISDTPNTDQNDITITFKTVENSPFPDIGTLEFSNVTNLFNKNIAPFFAPRPEPLKEGNYTCTCTLDSGCALISISQYLQKGVSHFDIPLATAKEQYLPKSKSEQTGWQCILQEDKPTSTTPTISDAEYSKAFEKYTAKAQTNDAKAQYRLGIMYAKGWGTEKDEETAKLWLKKAADQGHKKAATRLNQMNRPKQKKNK